MSTVTPDGKCFACSDYIRDCVCPLNEVSRDADHEFVEAWMEYNEFFAEDDPDLEPLTYVEYLESTIDDHEQIWREEPRERDLTESYLVALRKELAKHASA
jgi:hypothetical protein